MRVPKYIHWLTFNFGIMVLALASGCETAHIVESGVLATPGCTIQATDNSFTIASGKEFFPPFQMKEGWQVGAPDPLKSRKLALRMGAEPVNVSVPGRNTPLYGLLALFMTDDEGTGPGARSYRMEIPQQYVDAASGGQVSVVYETYKVGDAEMYSWILWLSDQPLVPPGTKPGRNFKRL